MLAEHVPSSPTRPARSATRRCATAARIGGSLAHGDPASDLPAVVLALGATLVAQGPGGEREIAAADFLPGVLRDRPRARRDAHRDPGPKMHGAGWSFQKFNRRAQDWAIVGCAVVHGAPLTPSHWSIWVRRPCAQPG